MDFPVGGTLRPRRSNVLLLHFLAQNLHLGSNVKQGTELFRNFNLLEILSDIIDQRKVAFKMRHRGGGVRGVTKMTIIQM